VASNLPVVSTSVDFWPRLFYALVVTIAPNGLFPLIMHIKAVDDVTYLTVRSKIRCDPLPVDLVHLPVDLLRPFSADIMTAWKVSKAVGNVKNDNPSLIAPI
jgi:hypothetical protein